MIERMAEKENSDYATTRQKLMDMLGGTLLGRPTSPKGSPSWSPSLRQAFPQTGRKADPSAFRTSPAKQIRQDSGG